MRNQTLWQATLALMLLFVSLVASADSYVFITNSTPETVRIEVAHTGNNGTLVPGKEWRQEAWEIAPYATERVLAFNRYWGVKRGRTYQFDTHVISGDSRVTVQQSMTGTWSGSNIRHSAKAADFNAPWMTDRHIHRYNSTFAEQASQVAFSAKFTGGYDDFYYVISNNTQDEPVVADSVLKVLSYNVYALPLIASDINARLAEIPDYLKGYDAILFQEAFSGSSPDMLRALASEYPYQTEILRKPLSGINVYNGGVAIVSRYPITQADYFVYPDCTGTDCFADKGFVYAEMLKAGEAYHLMATHAASFDTDAARQLRQVQFTQMRQFIESRQVPAFEAVLYGGDFNVNKLKFADDYAAMQQNLNASVPTITGYTESTFDPRVNYYAAKYDTVEYLDYVVWSNAHRQPTDSRNDVRVPRSISNALWERWDLSDHFPVLGEFVFD